MSRISSHAVSRYRKRVEPLPYDQVMAQLDCPAVRLAIEIGANAVKLPSGHRAIIADGKVVTVLSKPKHRAALRGTKRPHQMPEIEA